MRQKIDNNEVYQYGFMYGFPLFNIDGSGNWSYFQDFDTSETPGYEGWEDTTNRFNEPTDPTGYRNFRPPLLNISDTSKNLIVLDFQNLDLSGTIIPNTSFVNQNVFSDLDLKYLVLRVKYGNEEVDVNERIPVNQYWNVQPVIYKFMCDIVNPYNCLDFKM